MALLFLFSLLLDCLMLLDSISILSYTQTIQTLWFEKKMASCFAQGRLGTEINNAPLLTERYTEFTYVQ